jgi:hypothetical protein
LWLMWLMCELYVHIYDRKKANSCHLRVGESLADTNSYQADIVIRPPRPLGLVEAWEAYFHTAPFSHIVWHTNFY